ncbi:MAG: phosphonoacetate hydrolase [Alphaproteobacteria bacterium]|nr:phosphonoacetate hydrolase [Alphaproteobacteria bacterium]
MNIHANRVVEANGRTYAWPKAPLVVVCIDGSEPDYIELAAAAGCMPYLAGALKRGTSLLADCVVPSFTNPNNLSILTGRPPSVHGISGNFFLDPASGQEVMMNDPAYLRAGTVFAAFQRAGARVALVTAKDKLRAMLGHGLKFDGSAVCFSSEKADKANLAENGIEGVVEMVGQPVPSVYSAELSGFVFAAGVKLMERFRPDLMYLSTTDYIQHKHAPGSPVANDFYAMMDRHLAALDRQGAVIALTADHGMNDKHDAALKPDVIYLQALLDEWLGEGEVRVILPITDPYVVHHGALGSYATVYLGNGVDAEALRLRIAALPGIEVALDRAEACRRFELPPDRVGDLVVVSTRHKVIGTRPERHDLSGLKEPLRSHGGISEQVVPLIVTRPLKREEPGRRWRNFDILDLALNHVAA